MTNPEQPESGFSYAAARELLVTEHWLTPAEAAEILGPNDEDVADRLDAFWVIGERVISAYESGNPRVSDEDVPGTAAARKRAVKTWFQSYPQLRSGSPDNPGLNTPEYLAKEIRVGRMAERPIDVWTSDPKGYVKVMEIALKHADYLEKSIEHKQS